MIWIPPKVWQDGGCWIVGGGPSIREVFGIPNGKYSDIGDYFKPIHNRHIIGVNNAYKLGNWIDILFFGDGKWYRENKVTVKDFPGLLVSCSAEFEKSKIIKYVPRDNKHKRGISTKKGKISWNRNSGAAAVNLAYHLGAKTIFLLGFDMDYGANGFTHWFGSYAGDGQFSTVVPPFETHLKGFAQICADAKKLGLEILNVNLSSKIEEFPKITLDQALKWGQ